MKTFATFREKKDIPRNTFSLYLNINDAPLCYERGGGLWSAHICCEKGLDLVYRERDHPGIVQKRTAQGGFGVRIFVVRRG